MDYGWTASRTSEALLATAWPTMPRSIRQIVQVYVGRAFAVGLPVPLVIWGIVVVHSCLSPITCANASESVTE